MARYIRAVECAEKISEIFHIPLGDLVDVFAEISSADVVPKAKFEKEKEKAERMQANLEAVLEERAETRQEIEKEIGEEIYRIIGECHNETWVCLLMKEFADKLIKEK